MEALWRAYLPFVWENRYVFRCAGVRELRDRLSPEDRARIPWDPEALDWRRYWLDVHMKGMEEWVFPGLEEEAGRRVHAPRAHRDLLELLDAACERWKDRVALRMEGAVKERLTYGELRALSGRVAGFLAAAGVGKGDRVILSGENRPEWAVAFFGILRAGAAVVPVDPKLSGPEIANVWRSSGARVALVTDQTADALPDLAALAVAAVPGARLVLLGEALRHAGPPAAPARIAPDDLASLIFTSGTTGTPKGVMLSHRNFASLVAKLCTVFDLGPGDGMLSVLPLHHTFEFTCGLLVPLSRGAEVEYLDELTADRIGEASTRAGSPPWSASPRSGRCSTAASRRRWPPGPALVQQAFDALLRGTPRCATPRSAGTWARRSSGRCTAASAGGSASSSRAAPPSTPRSRRPSGSSGFDLYEGYGLTEAAPVLAVSKPDADAPRRQRRAGAARASSSGSRSRTRAAWARCWRAGRTSCSATGAAARRPGSTRSSPARCWRAAGCAPAISAGSTPTATSRWSGARRT